MEEMSYTEMLFKKMPLDMCSCATGCTEKKSYAEMLFKYFKIRTRSCARGPQAAQLQKISPWRGSHDAHEYNYSALPMLVALVTLDDLKYVKLKSLADQ